MRITALFRHPCERECNPIGRVRGRLQKIGHSIGFSAKSQGSPLLQAYPKLGHDIRYCRNQTEIHHRFSESQLDYTLVGRWPTRSGKKGIAVACPRGRRLVRETSLKQVMVGAGYFRLRCGTLAASEI